MLKLFLPVFILIFSMGILTAQSFNVNIHSSSKSNIRAQAPDTVKILAILVNFHEDRDGATFGNGKFGSIYSVDYGNTILDPLPHDAPYFEDHLTFVRNYFTKVSKDNLHIEFTVLPDTFSVSKTMRNYSPPPGSDDFTPLAEFAVEAWTLADQIYQGFNFSSYDLFIIFHAGVGRDISLPGSIGNERDLPSVYLNDKSLKEIFGESFDGIPVLGGSFNITNSMIIPETESRELNTISGTFLFQITINGLIAASVCSHLGLPDLFDTETGLSAIGRFGLMDGQGIFAYSGTYPPEPCPWSKIYLGWAEPITVPQENFNASLVTNLAAEMGDTVIIKVPLNSSEYYLIENRSRDANQDGSIVTYKVGGTTFTKTFLKDTTGYNSFDVDSLAGVITNVDEFDWAVPGSGLVIWHIDENVINEKLADNQINTDKNQRGVDVEEADGIQDIGEEFQTIFGDRVIGEGTFEDLWNSSNPAELFQNLFANDTRPNTRTNTDANSLITMKDFSDISNRMDFNVEFGDSVIKPLFTYQFQSAPTHISSVNFNGEIYFIVILHDNSLNILKEDSLIYQSPEFSFFKPATTVENNTLYVFGNSKYLMTDGVNFNQGILDVPGFIITPNVINTNLAGENEVWSGSTEDKVYIFTFGVLPNLEPVLRDSITLDSGYRPIMFAVDEDFYAIISYPTNRPLEELTLFTSATGNLTINNNSGSSLALTKDKDGRDISVVFTRQGSFHIISNDVIINSFNSTTSLTPLNFSLLDLRRDGNNYVSINSSSEIVTYNLNGSIADNFPASFNDKFVGTIFPLSADFEGDGNSEIISITLNGNIYAVDGGTGKVVSGFPISIGDTVTATPSLFNYEGKTSLIAANSSGLLKAWVIGSVEGDIIWKEEFSDNENSSFIPAAENTNRINEFLPSSRAYNYPNPVYDGETNIRYYVSEDSKINIKIFDLAGDFVDEMNDDAQGGMDNETVWNVSDIQSGVYLARIEAVSASNQSEFAIVKIAVVK